MTSIEFDPVDDNFFWVGNFDHQMRYYDMRMTQVPLVKLNTGGSVWRIIAKDKYIGVSMSGPNMFKIYEKQGDDWKEIVQDSTTHESMVYGFDYRILPSEEKALDIFSCSFYDGLICRQQF